MVVAVTLALCGPEARATTAAAQLDVLLVALRAVEKGVRRSGDAWLADAAVDSRADSSLEAQFAAALQSRCSSCCAPFCTELANALVAILHAHAAQHCEGNALPMPLPALPAMLPLPTLLVLPLPSPADVPLSLARTLLHVSSQRLPTAGAQRQRRAARLTLIVRQPSAKSPEFAQTARQASEPVKTGTTQEEGRSLPRASRQKLDRQKPNPEFVSSVLRERKRIRMEREQRPERSPPANSFWHESQLDLQRRLQGQQRQQRLSQSLAVMALPAASDASGVDDVDDVDDEDDVDDVDDDPVSEHSRHRA
jgi:hypothetical protein